MMQDKMQKLTIIKEVRGRGLFIAIETANYKKSTLVNGNDLADILMTKERILAKSTHDSCLRIAPVLGLTDAETERVGKKLIRAVNHLNSLNRQRKKEQ